MAAKKAHPRLIVADVFSGYVDVARNPNKSGGVPANARDSLRQAVELLAWKDIGSDHARLKHAITNAAL
jgi:hypothetical protein